MWTILSHESIKTVHISKSCNSIRDESSLHTTVGFPTAEFTDIKCKRCDQCKFSSCTLSYTRVSHTISSPDTGPALQSPKAGLKSWLPACLLLSTWSHLFQQTNLSLQPPVGSPHKTFCTSGFFPCELWQIHLVKFSHDLETCPVLSEQKALACGAGLTPHSCDRIPHFTGDTANKPWMNTCSWALWIHKDVNATPLSHALHSTGTTVNSHC